MRWWFGLGGAVVLAAGAWIFWPRARGALPAATGPDAAVTVLGEILAGRVTDAEGLPEVGIEVVVASEGAGQVAATTDSQGRFSLSGLRPGMATVRAAGVVMRVSVPGPAFTMVLTRRVRVAGVVSDFAGPVAGAVVAAGGRETTTGADGSFLFGDLSEGEYVVTARAEGRAAVAQVSRVGVGPWEDLALVLTPAATVAGHVVDAVTEDGVGGAVVVLEPVAEARAPFETTTAADGSFTIDAVPSGTWAVHARGPGYLTALLPAIEVGAEPVRLEVPLERGGTVVGRVVGEDGVGISGAAVEVRSEHGAWPRRKGALATSGLIPRGELGVTTGPVPYPPPAGASVPAAAASPGPTSDGEGRFRISAIPAGSYMVSAQHPDYAPAAGARFEVNPVVETDCGTVTLHRGAAVVGTVTHAAHGTPIVDAYIRTRGGPDLPVWTDSRGAFRTGRLWGEVLLIAGAHGFAPQERALRIGPEDEGKEVEESFALVSARLALAGIVLDPLRRPVEGAEVEALDAHGLKVRAMTDGQGRFLLEGLAEGSQRLKTSHRDFVPTEIETAAGAAAVEVVLALGGGIEGLARDAHTGARIAAFVVTATGPHGRTSRSFKNGSFRLGSLAPGTWTLELEAKGHVRHSQKIDVPAGREAGEVTVRDVVIELSQGAMIAGIVYDAHGERAVRALVTAGAQRVTTDARGAFRLSDVETGEVVVRATHPQHGDGATTVPLRPGDEVLTLRITLGE